MVREEETRGRETRGTPSEDAWPQCYAILCYPMLCNTLTSTTTSGFSEHKAYCLVWNCLGYPLTRPDFGRVAGPSAAA